VIILAARLVGGLARRLGQPAVIGEITAGILLGPTFFHGAVANVLFSGAAQVALSAVAICGLAVFMFLMGWELRLTSIRKDGRVALSVAAGSTILPFALGVGLAFLLARDHAHGRPVVFVLFFATAMSVTAFPVLARILADHGMHRSHLGSVALTSAALADVVAWSMLAVLTAVAGPAGTRPWLIALVVPYVAAMVGIVRPFLQRLGTALETTGRGFTGFLSIVLAGILLSGAVAEQLGLHYIFGAFLFGAVMPRVGTKQMRRDMMRCLEPICEVLLLPVFFVIAGLRVDLSHLGATGVGLLALIVLVAVTGKFVGGFTPARLQGVDRRQSAVLAVLMNTRGLTELVVLSIGVELGVLDHDLYSAMVLMALITTAITSPILRMLSPRQHTETNPADLLTATSHVDVDARKAWR
jgi:Kef-type K+ transport system membrane component KefB